MRKSNARLRVPLPKVFMFHDYGARGGLTDGRMICLRRVMKRHTRAFGSTSFQLGSPATIQPTSFRVTWGQYALDDCYTWYNKVTIIYRKKHHWLLICDRGVKLNKKAISVSLALVKMPPICAWGKTLCIIYHPTCVCVFVTCSNKSIKCNMKPLSYLSVRKRGYLTSKHEIKPYVSSVT